MTTHRDLWAGTPTALGVLADALTRAGVPDDGRPLRDRVKNWQKKTGRTPTGAIWPADWDELTAARIATDDTEDADDVGTEEGPEHED